MSRTARITANNTHYVKIAEGPVAIAINPEDNIQLVIAANTAVPNVAEANTFILKNVAGENYINFSIDAGDAAYVKSLHLTGVVSWLEETGSEVVLMANATATSNAFNWAGGKGVFTPYIGTFSGATVKLQWSPDAGTTWLDVDKSGDTFVTFTAVGSGGFELPGCKIRANVSGSPTGLYAKALKV